MHSELLCKRILPDAAVTYLRETNTVVNTRPDILWFQNRAHAFLVHEHKKCVDFTYDEGTGTNISDIFEAVTADSPNITIKNALEQVYGYMLVLGLTHAVLSNTEWTWFLQRDDANMMLLVSDGYEATSEGSESMRTAYMSFLMTALRAAGDPIYPEPGSPLYAHVEAQWQARFQDNHGRFAMQRATDAGKAFIKSMLDRAVASRNLRSRRRDDNTKSGDDDGPRYLTVAQLGALLPLPWDVAYTKISDSGSRVVQRLRVNETISLVLKDLIIDSADVRNTREEMQNEIAAYDDLVALQGSVLPFLVFGGHAAGRFLVVTTDAGDSLSHVKPPFADNVYAGAIAALDALHDAGYMHGDVALRNIVLDSASGRVRLIDLGRARLEGDKGILDEEKRALRALFEE